MSAKQDRTAPRTASDIERRFNNKKTFAELLGLAQAAQNAAENARKELEGLTAEEIFNILTDGGIDQGIYRIDGKIYLNATYIKSGVLLANLIKAGVLQSNDGKTFYLDLDKGILKMNATELTISGKSVDSYIQDKVNESSGYEPTFEDIFNALTENGKYKGIYFEDGELYINATYIKSGEFVADLIKTGILQSQDGNTFYLDLDNGVLNMNATKLTIAGTDVDSYIQDKINASSGYEPTFEDIFNALTDNGTKKGIYLEDGELYINATYIKSGQLVADLIKTGVLQSKDGTTFYLDLDNGILKGQFTEFSIAGKTVATAEDLNAFKDSVLSDIENMQSQMDGNITSWFYSHVPSADNEPAVNWTTDEDKNIHLGDLFYIVDNEEHGGLVYRWALVNGTYQWTLVEDSEVAKALADAAEAKDIADGKRRVFVTTPTPPYDVGDLWAQGSEGDLMRCKTARSANESYLAEDWELASKYIDADQAGDIAQEKVDGQTQEDIFNKLTNDGTVKGIYLENGELYINATYIKSGQLTADLIKAGILQSKDGKTFYLDLDNGVLNLNATKLTISGKDVEQMMDDKIAAAEPGDYVYEPTQEEIFNALTNNGASKGIYMENGELYINGNYIMSGVLAAGLIKTGILQSNDGKSFYLDLDNDVLKATFEELTIKGKNVATEEYASEQANNQANLAVNGQTQEAIFNKLTNNGEEQGIYLKDGKLYINASYMASGVISSANGGVVIDLLNDTFQLNNKDSGGYKARLDFTGHLLSLLRENTDTGDLDATLTISAATTGSEGLPLCAITAQKGTNLVLSANADSEGNQGYVQVGLANKPVKIMGKTVEWKSNGDGTYTLIGRD